MDRKDRLRTKKSAMRFLYDWDEKTVFGRTTKNWAQIILFYIIFYLVLSALFVIFMCIAMRTIDPRKPKWKLDESVIGTNPGLGFRPMPKSGVVESTLIWYRKTDKENYWVKNLKEFLEVYRKPVLIPGRGQNIYNCDYNRPPGRGQVCNVDIKSWGPCSPENDFNHQKSPCFFLKLNRIYGWVPEYYNSTGSLPEQMPAALKNHIANVSLTRPHELNTVWVTCEGENPVDVENLRQVNYIPSQGFPGYFYPYENTEGYLSPIVAVHIESPKSGVIIKIECKAWAKNIKHNRQDRIGSIRLELKID